MGIGGYRSPRPAASRFVQIRQFLAIRVEIARPHSLRASPSSMIHSEQPSEGSRRLAGILSSSVVPVGTDTVPVPRAIAAAPRFPMWGREFCGGAAHCLPPLVSELDRRVVISIRDIVLVTRKVVADDTLTATVLPPGIARCAPLLPCRPWARPLSVPRDRLGTTALIRTARPWSHGSSRGALTAPGLYAWASARFVRYSGSVRSPKNAFSDRKNGFLAGRRPS